MACGRSRGLRPGLTATAARAGKWLSHVAQPGGLFATADPNGSSFASHLPAPLRGRERGRCPQRAPAEPGPQAALARSAGLVGSPTRLPPGPGLAPPQVWLPVACRWRSKLAPGPKLAAPLGTQLLQPLALLPMHRTQKSPSQGPGTKGTHPEVWQLVCDDSPQIRIARARSN